MQTRVLALVLAVAVVSLGHAAQAEEQPTKADAPAKKKETKKKRKKAEDVPRLGEVVVEAKRPLSAASSDEIQARDYELRPHATTQEILNNIPGLVVAQHQGGGK